MPQRRVVIDHLKIGVSDLARSRGFYRRALEPLGYAEMGAYGAFVLDPDGHNVEAVYHPAP